MDSLLGKRSRGTDQGNSFMVAVVLWFSRCARKLHTEMMLALRFSFIYLTGAAAAYVTGCGADITVIPFEWSIHPTET